MRDGHVPGRVVDPELCGALDGRTHVVVAGAARVVGLVRRRQRGQRCTAARRRHVQLERRHHAQQRVRGGRGGLSGVGDLEQNLLGISCS